MQTSGQWLEDQGEGVDWCANPQESWGILHYMTREQAQHALTLSGQGWWDHERPWAI